MKLITIKHPAIFRCDECGDLVHAAIQLEQLRIVLCLSCVDKVCKTANAGSISEKGRDIIITVTRKCRK